MVVRKLNCQNGVDFAHCKVDPMSSALFFSPLLVESVVPP